MNTRFILSMFLVLTASLVIILPAFALKGTVVDQNGDTYIIETRNGYVMATLDDGYAPEVGDVLVGEMEKRGLHTLYNMSADQELDMVIKAHQLAKQNDNKPANISIKVIMSDNGYGDYPVVTGNYNEHTSYNKYHKKDKHEHEEEDD